jgi:hypothetical protein
LVKNARRGAQEKLPSHNFQTQAWDGGAIRGYSITANRMLNESHCALIVLKSEAIGRSPHKVSPGRGDTADATGECGELVLCMNHCGSFNAMEPARNHGPNNRPNHRKT